MRELCLLNQNLPSDIIFGDIDGVLCIPREIAYDVLLRAEGIELLMGGGCLETKKIGDMAEDYGVQWWKRVWH